MSDEQRLDRIEQKLDKLADAVVSLARMEERMLTLFKRMDTHDNRISKTEEDLDDLKGRVGTNGQALRFAERVFWIVLAAGVTFAFKTVS
jgi:predicted  nucleic acid-binding Zn-ribbon protein